MEPDAPEALARLPRCARRVLAIGLAAWLAALAAPAAADIGGCPVFPADNIWNTPVDNLPVHPSSAAFINSIGANTGLHPDFGSGTYNGGPIGIPFVTVPGSQPKVPINFTDYGDESDPGPYPIPPSAPIEGGPNSQGDRHVLVIDTGNCVLYELFYAFRVGGGTSWNASSGARFDLNSNALRPDGFTSADAAGVAIFPGLVRHDEAAAGVIRHALRFTAQVTRRTHVWPARHDAGSTSSLSAPPMGQRFRLKASKNISGFPPKVRAIFQAMKTYGLVLTDNGSNWYITGAPDPGWDNDELNSSFAQLKGSDFEAVDVSSLLIDPNSGQAKGGILSVDAPGAGASMPQSFLVGGWALDRTAVTGTGISAVHVYAVPAAGSPVFLGVASYGAARPDIAALFGAQFTNSGYGLAASGLTPGSYTLQVFAQRTATGAFDLIQARAITIISGARMSVDGPAPGAAVTQPFNLGGWAVDLGTGSGTGVDTVHVYAAPAGGSPVFLGQASYGGSRPDIGGLFGPQFTGSGFNFAVNGLAPGLYQLHVFARSTVSGAFDNVRTVPITINSTGRMALDAPGPGARVRQPLLVAGWALDLAAPSGTGVDTVHVYAFPAGGGAPIFLGEATYGGARPDIGAAFGGQFTGSAFGLVAGGLPPGTYQIQALARSTVTGTFNNVQAVTVVTFTDPRLAVDTPAPGATPGQPFVIAGWAVDLGAAAGTGVDTVHVYAFPAGGGAPEFLGEATYGGARPDIGTAFGGQFTNSAWGLVVTGLDPGAYELRVFARSTVTNTFNNVKALPVTVP
jgi:hypothetical protein